MDLTKEEFEVKKEYYQEKANKFDAWYLTSLPMNTGIGTMVIGAFINAWAIYLIGIILLVAAILSTILSLFYLDKVIDCSAALTELTIMELEELTKKLQADIPFTSETHKYVYGGNDETDS